MVLFCLHIKKKSDDGAYDYVSEDVKNFIQKIESMSENINQSFFNDFFELALVDYAKMLINTKNLDKNKKSVAEIEYRISNLIKDKIKEMSKKEKKVKVRVRH